jgi:hypothetical protein
VSSPQPTLLPPLTTVSVGYDVGQNPWLAPKLSGVSLPGTIVVPGGLQGFKRQTGWDIQAGKGTAGAQLILKDQPPVGGTVTMQLVTAADFAAWDAFVFAVLSISREDQKANGLSWYYPGHASIGLTVVVVENYTGPVPQKPGGVFHVTIQIIEWSPPPATSIVQTVASTSLDADDASTFSNQPANQDPRITALQNQIAGYQSGGTNNFSPTATP